MGNDGPLALMAIRAALGPLNLAMPYRLTKPTDE